MGRFSPVDALKIEGFRETISELQKLDDKHINKELAHAHMELGKLVAFTAKPRMQSSRAAATLKPSNSAKKVSLNYGTNAVPWAQGQEWGSNRYPQFPPVKKGGYTIYPAIEEKNSQIIKIYEREMDKVMRHAFPD